MRLFVSLGVLLSLVFCQLAYSYEKNEEILEIGNQGFVAGPVLISPTTDNIDLTGKESLEFKWDRTALVDTRVFEFRLYKGYEQTQENLIFKQDVPTDTYPIRVTASYFKAGQAYTWSLTQVLITGAKSDKSVSTFEVIGK